ncbi:hypothetical protein AB4516_14565 [Vibrio sp. 10N.222.54.F12]|uniref:hypothetical protein n=1 Tax=Vibrio TaxID=662 RepID=UPI000C82E9D0|nr:hypothetical protein [Vibrio tasmaniensis]PML19169.1 hypothetical protein BCT83_03270 [Vibrio tasmaniensis]
MSRSIKLLTFLNEKRELNWVFDEVVGTIKQGYTEEATSTLTADNFQLGESISKTDHKKLKGYEKTREYTQDEVSDLVIDRLKFLHLEVPEFQQSAFKLFHSINPSLTEIQLVDSDDGELKGFELIKDTGLLKWREIQDDLKTRQERFDRFLLEVDRVCE